MRPVLICAVNIGRCISVDLFLVSSVDHIRCKQLLRRFSSLKPPWDSSVDYMYQNGCK